VKALNPFIPTIPLMTVPDRSQRERFKRWFVIILTVHVAFVLGLLLRDYRHEMHNRSQASDSSAPLSEQVGANDAVAPTQAPEQSQMAMISTPAQAPALFQTAVAPEPARAQVTPIATTPSAPPHSESTYVVKSGDTLSQIARESGLSIRALKSANSLTGERLVVGQKLNLR
jgi:LysM repeat protein